MQPAGLTRPGKSSRRGWTMHVHHRIIVSCGLRLRSTTTSTRRRSVRPALRASAWARSYRTWRVARWSPSRPSGAAGAADSLRSMCRPAPPSFPVPASRQCSTGMASSDRRPRLLDVNALVALAWPNHQFHRVVLARLDERPVPLWATCALTQLGFVRLSSNPAIVGVRRTPAQALELLDDLVRDRRHRYLESLPPPRQSARHFRHLLGHQQVTDAYLLAVAAKNRAVLLTLDRRLAVSDTARTSVEVVTP